jgi:hypothetical protein
MTVEPWYQTKEFIAAVSGPALAFALIVLYDYLRSRRRRRAHFAALRAELDYCHELAQTYQRDNVASPLYRLPTVAYANALPALLADAALGEEELKRLLTFFNEVETLNRGLDQADSALSILDAQASNNLLAGVVARNRLKAERLAPLSSSTPSYCERARTVLDARLCWFRL